MGKWFSFYNPVKVRFGEVDMFGHVNNVVAFTYFEEARIALFKELGFMQEWTHESSETMIVVADLQCNFIKQIYFDEQLKVCKGRLSWEFFFRFTLYGQKCSRRSLFSWTRYDGSSIEKPEEANHGLKSGRDNYYNDRVKENKRAKSLSYFCLPSLPLMLNDVYICM